MKSVKRENENAVCMRACVCAHQKNKSRGRLPENAACTAAPGACTKKKLNKNTCVNLFVWTCVCIYIYIRERERKRERDRDREREREIERKRKSERARARERERERPRGIWGQRPL